MRGLCVLILVFVLALSDLTSAQHQDCVDGVCSCVKGWTGERCTEPDKRSPFPCFWREKSRYFKYSGQPKEYLKQLSCRSRRLKTLNNVEAFRGDTEFLDLGHNYFLDAQAANDLKNNVLKYMPELRQITLDRCSMVTLGEDFFKENPELEGIDLKWNQITQLSPDTFKHNPKLVKITLSGNPLESLPDDIFADNPELREVRLDFTMLKQLPTTLFNHNSYLRYLNLNYNMELWWMSARMFDDTPSLEFVGLLNTWFLHPEMRREFCEEDWCLRAGNYPPISQLVQLLDQYFDEEDYEE